MTRAPDVRGSSFAAISCDFSSSGGGIRTRDLRVMSPTSYQTAPPRGGHSVIAQVWGDGEAAGARLNRSKTGWRSLDTDARWAWGWPGGSVPARGRPWGCPLD